MGEKYFASFYIFALKLEVEFSKLGKEDIGIKRVLRPWKAALELFFPPAWVPMCKQYII